MKIIVASRALFNEYLTRKGITDANVETQKNLMFISINNQDDKQPPHFTSNKNNVINMVFADLEEDKELPIIGENRTELFKAMTKEQAAELYAFIKANKDKEVALIHCTAGVARSGAVGVFINDFIGGSWEELKRNNPSIQPNPHVYRLLHDEWYKDIAHNDAITGEPIDGFKLEVLNPKPQELIVAEYNARNPDQFTSIKEMTIEEIQKQYPGMKIISVPDKGPSRYEEVYPNGDRVVGGSRYIHPDGSSSYVMGIDPFRNDPQFESFWLETDKFYGMVDEKELNVVGHLHHLQEILPARKKMLPTGEFEAFASFGFGPEYNGIDLRTWLTLKNMNSFFKWFGSGMILTSIYAKEDRYGLDGTNFKLALNKEFKFRDVLTNGFKEGVNVFVTDEPVELVSKEVNDCGEDYWVHTVRLVTNDSHVFMARKYLMPGTRYYKM